MLQVDVPVLFVVCIWQHTFYTFLFTAFIKADLRRQKANQTVEDVTTVCIFIFCHGGCLWTSHIDLGFDSQQWWAQGSWLNSHVDKQCWHFDSCTNKSNTTFCVTYISIWLKDFLLCCSEAIRLPRRWTIICERGQDVRMIFFALLTVLDCQNKKMITDAINKGRCISS